MVDDRNFNGFFVQMEFGCCGVDNEVLKQHSKQLNKDFAALSCMR